MEKVTKEIIQRLILQQEIALLPTQTKLCVPIINRMYKKMVAGINFSGIKVENDLICDGHHRYIASLLANFELEQFLGTTTSATIAINWESVLFEEEDWDTSAKINMLNEQDAAYNNIPVRKIAELLE